LLTKFVGAYAIVVGELTYEMVVFGSVADHGLGPLSIIGTIASGLAAFLELLMTKDLNSLKIIAD